MRRPAGRIDSTLLESPRSNRDLGGANAGGSLLYLVFFSSGGTWFGVLEFFGQTCTSTACTTSS